MPTVNEFRDRLAQFNKHYLNPLTLSFAGRPGVPWGIIQHIGRRTGNRYTTPVLVGPTYYAFYIPLPYGQTTDWARNVQEEGGGLVVYGGEAYRVIEPHIVIASEAAGAFPRWVQSLLAAAGTTNYLRVQRAAPSPEPETVYQRITADYPTRTGLWIIGAVLLIAVGVGRALWKLLHPDRD